MEFSLYSLQDRTVILMVALLAAGLLGGQTQMRHFLFLDRPERLVCAALAGAERRLNRAQRGDAARRRRGILLVLIVLCVCLAIGVAADYLAARTRWSVAFELALLIGTLPLREALRRAGEIRKALHEKNEEKARTLVMPLARRDEGVRDAHAMLRAAIEYLALTFSTRLVAPAFWYLLLGLPAALFVTALTVMDGMFASRAMAYAAFSSTVARLDDLAQLVPSRFAGLLLAVAAVFAPGCNPARAFQGALQGAGKTVSPNNGIPLGAAAGALGIALAGPRCWLGWTIKDAWIEFGTARVEQAHLVRMQYLYGCACMVLVLLCAAASLAQRG